MSILSNIANYLPIAKPLGNLGFQLDWRTQLKDTTVTPNTFRDYVSTDEVKVFLSQTDATVQAKMRKGAIVWINSTGTLANGQITGGQRDEYWFRNGETDNDLVIKQANISTLLLTGLTAGTNVPIAETDNVLGAFAKLQSQLSALATLASSTVKGLMSATDKSKLDGIAAGATANVPSSDAENTDGTDNVKYVTPIGLKNWWANIKLALVIFQSLRVTALAGGGSSSLVTVDNLGNLLVGTTLFDPYETDSDIIAAITSADYSDGGSAIISPANDKVFMRGKETIATGYYYYAFQDNNVARTKLAN